MRALLFAVACAFCALPCRAEDSDERRYYLDFRYEDLLYGATKAHDGAGLSAGMNLSRYLSVELSLDTYDVKVESASESEVLGFVPAARLRYPFLNDRLVPYLTAGAGLAVTQANDAKQPVHWQGGKTSVLPAGVVGGGIEYFISDNVAIGLNARYLITGDIGYTIEGEDPNSLNVSAALAGVGVRVYYPELHPTENLEAARQATARFYLGLRTGGALLVNLQPFPGVSATPEQSLAGSNFTPLFGATVGVNLGRYAGVELALTNYELKLATSDLGGIGEYSVFPIAVQPRLRYPLLDDRLVPFASAGVGAEFSEINDRNAQGKAITVTAKDITVIGTFSAGIEYYIMSNVSISGEAEYIISRGHTMQLEDGPTLNGNFDSFLLSIGLRIGLFDL